jgi:HK97 family phage major capsid protein
MSLSKQIEALRKQRTTQIDALSAISILADGDESSMRLLTPEEQKEFDKVKAGIDDIDQTISRLLAAEKAIAEKAQPVQHPLVPLVEPQPRKAFKAFQAQAFTRYCMALAVGRGNLMQSLEVSKRWDEETPEVGAILRAAVAAGTTTDPAWAAPLVNYTVMTSEFIEFLRPMTILGQMSGFRSVPFNIKIPRQTAGATANWVGEGLSKPVSPLAFDQVTIPFAKVAVIAVITQELARFSSPSAEMLVRDDLASAIAQFLDTQFIDPAVTASAGLRPASITNGVTAIPSTGSTVAAVTTDVQKAMARMISGLGAVSRPVWVMNPSAAMFLSTMRTAQDIFAFPGMGGVSGGQQTGLNLMGVPVILSGNVAVSAGLSNLILVDQSQILVADDGQVTVDTSTEAAVQLDSAPASPPTPLVSFWQQNLLGIKAERFIYWLRRRLHAVEIITGFPQGGVLPTMTEEEIAAEAAAAQPPAA